VPFEHTVTIPSDRVLANSLREECKVYYIKRELFGLGKTTLPTPAGNQVPVYDLERTICDIVRSRNKIGTETFLAALKAYAANPKKDLNRLNAYAKQMRLSNIIRKYLEVLL
jgi:predicted transcriptional regulator of viral defense system